MVAGLIDTSILVDYLRGYGPSGDWVLTASDLGVSRAALLELIEGAQSKRAYQDVIRLVGLFKLVETSTEGFVWATSALANYRHSHNVDAFDCLIAATSIRLSLPLYTRNLKHFAPMLASLAVVPY